MSTPALLAAFWLAAAPLSAAAPATGKAGARPAASIRWQPSFEKALQAAKAARKPVMVDFWAEWCGYCHKLDRTTYRDPAVVRASRASLVSVKVDTEGSEADQKVAGRYLVRSLPTIAFLSPGGRQLERINGYLPAEMFPQFLERAQEVGAPVIAWEAALDKNPNDVDALVGLGFHQFRVVQRISSEDADQLIPRSILMDAKDLLTRAAGRDKERPVAERKRLRRTLALVHGAEGKLPEAMALLKEALALTPADAAQDAEASVSLGDLYLHQKDTRLARETFEKTVKQYAGSPAAARAQQKLARLAPPR